MRKGYTVRQLTQAFGVSASGYYAYLNRSKRIPTERDLEDKKMIQALYDKTGGTYGAKRIAGTLKAQKNHVINHKRVARLMGEMNIKAKVRIKKTTQTKKKIAGGIYLSKCFKPRF